MGGSEARCPAPISALAVQSCSGASCTRSDRHGVNAADNNVHIDIDNYFDINIDSNRESEPISGWIEPG